MWLLFLHLNLFVAYYALLFEMLGGILPPSVVLLIYSVIIDVCF